MAAALHDAHCGAYSSPLMDSDHPSDSFIHASPFEVTVRTRSWDWLHALSRRLHFEVQLVDPNGRALTASGFSEPSVLGHLAATCDADIHSLLEAATSSRASQTATIQGVSVAAYPLSDRGEVVGAVLMAYPLRGQEAATDQPIGREAAAAGVLDSINAYLRTPFVAPGRSVDDVASLGRILDSTAWRTTDRELVAAFAAALGFWNGLDVYGYVMTADGTFVAEVSPPVPQQSKVPLTIPVGALPAASAPTLLSTQEVEALGIEHGADVLVARIPDGDFPWLIVCCGAMTTPEGQRLALYVQLLEQIMRAVMAEATFRLITTISAHLLEQGDAATEAAAAALDALGASIGSASTALKVTNGYSAPLLQLGQTEPPPADLAGSRLVIVRRVPNRYALTLVFTTHQRRGITRQQRDSANAAANLLNAWIRGMLARVFQRDRRQASTTFDEVLERLADQALEGGSTVSVIVVLIADSACFPGLTPQWIARIRATLRGSDVIGMLSEGEVALLLYDTTRERASPVAERIVKMLDAAHYPSPVVAIGVSSRPPGHAAGGGIVAAARSDARLRATASQSQATNQPGDDR